MEETPEQVARDIRSWIDRIENASGSAVVVEDEG
jgi:hypothetical protein